MLSHNELARELPESALSGSKPGISLRSLIPGFDSGGTGSGSSRANSLWLSILPVEGTILSQAVVDPLNHSLSPPQVLFASPAGNHALSPLRKPPESLFLSRSESPVPSPAGIPSPSPALVPVESPVPVPLEIPFRSPSESPSRSPSFHAFLKQTMLMVPGERRPGRARIIAAFAMAVSQRSIAIHIAAGSRCNCICEVQY